MRYKIFLVSLLACCALRVAAQQETPPSPHFAIQRFAVTGNTLLDPADIELALHPFVGENRNFADIQRALETLENLYRNRGYSTVSVSVPEQELEKGQVKLSVSEGRISLVKISGNSHFSHANIRASLPQLKEGQAPLALRLSENIQLANENPAKEVEVILARGDKDGDVVANIRVKDERPWKISATLDNTGSESTGQQRLGVAFQHNNIADTDQSLSLAYTTAPDKPSGVKVDIYSLAYRIPLYRLGDSIDLIAAHSSVGVPSSSPTLAGGLGIVGRGTIYGLRYNWLWPRQGEYASRVVFALDGKDMGSSCRMDGGEHLNDVAGCNDYRVRPLSATYVGRWQQTNRLAGFSLGYAQNIDASSSHSYDLASSNRAAPTSFNLWRASGNFVQELSSNWQLRIAAQAQFTGKPLVPTEQISLAGSTAVRGFSERAVAADQGHIVQTELYTPELSRFFKVPGSLRVLAFYDQAAGSSYRVVGNRRAQIASLGLGLRYMLDKNVLWRFDFANITESHALTSGGDPIDRGWRGHFSLTVSY